MEKRIQTFREFYPYYLSQHQNPICRGLHFIGTAIVIALAIIALLTFNWKLLFFIPIAGYGFAWIGHAFFEKNKPATFTYPLYSLMGDFKMFFELLTFKISFNDNKK